MPARRGQHSVQHLFELLPKQFELSNSILNGRELPPNQREKSRTESRAWPTVQRVCQGLELLKGQPQRARPTDEAQQIQA